MQRCAIDLIGEPSQRAASISNAGAGEPATQRERPPKPKAPAAFVCAMNVGLVAKTCGRGFGLGLLELKLNYLGVGSSRLF